MACIFQRPRHFGGFSHSIGKPKKSTLSAPRVSWTILVVSGVQTQPEAVQDRGHLDAGLAVRYRAGHRTPRPSA